MIFYKCWLSAETFKCPRFKKKWNFGSSPLTPWSKGIPYWPLNVSFPRRRRWSLRCDGHLRSPISFKRWLISRTFIPSKAFVWTWQRQSPRRSSHNRVFSSEALNSQRDTTRSVHTINITSTINTGGCIHVMSENTWRDPCCLCHTLYVSAEPEMIL